MIGIKKIDKGVLVAGGLILLGLVSYVLLRKDEKEPVEEADFTVLEEELVKQPIKKTEVKTVIEKVPENIDIKPKAPKK